MSHLGIRATQRLITHHFVWPNINADVRKWARSCLHCQRSKFHRHTTAPLGTFTTPDARFDRVHIDLVGPLPPSNGCAYLLTCVDRFTRWPEAVPIADSTAETVARAFVHTWIARFGTPSTVTTDRGRQFESHFWKYFTQPLGTKYLRTTAYHPCANGLVERFHHQLKAALKAHPHPEHWTEALPLVLLGIRTALKEDLGCTAAELVYGSTLRLPGGFFSQHTVDDNTDPGNYVVGLRTMMQKLRATPPRKGSRPHTHVSSTLSEATHVFVRHDAVHTPLQQPYDGPFKVISRKDKYFTLDLKGRRDTVSVDRLKPAHLDQVSDPPPTTIPPVQQPSTLPPTPKPSKPPATMSPPERSSRTTRTGRHVHWPAHLSDFIH